jgi:predicted PurR-regulated permease PerM
VISFRPKSVLVVLGVLIAVVGAIGFVRLTSSGLTLIAIAVFLSLALNPAVEFFQRRGLRRSLAVIAVFAGALGVLALLVLVFIPPMILQVSNLIQAIPGFVNTLSQGNGPAGILERKYQVVERIQAATSGTAFASWTTAALSGLDVIRRVATSFVGAILIAFLTLFMLFEGPAWRRRLTDLVPDNNRASIERVGAGVYKAVGGFVTGNLLASLASGVVATVLLLVTGVPYALPLGLFVVVLDLIPYIGPAVVTVLLTTVALTQGPVRALVVFGVLLAFHIIEGHTLRPLIYGRALRLSPLAVLISIVLGTEVAGILGALAAIPVAGAIQVIVAEILRHRAEVTPAAKSSEVPT